MYFKNPLSVLVLVHSQANNVLLLERAANPGYWQSVTGSQEGEETLLMTAVRELREETGIEASSEQLCDWQQTYTYEIFSEWRHRYAPGVMHNTEHVFSYSLPTEIPVRIAPREHSAYLWLPCAVAAEKVFSPSNRAVILQLCHH